MMKYILKIMLVIMIINTKYVFAITRHHNQSQSDINLGNLSINCTINTDGSNNCSTSDGENIDFINANSNINWSGQSISNIPSITNIANQKKLLVASYPSDKDHNSKQYPGFFLYFGNDYGYGNKKWDSNITFSVSKAQGQIITLSSTNRKTFNINIGLKGLGIYQDAYDKGKHAVVACGWNGADMQQHEVSNSGNIGTIDTTNQYYLLTDNTTSSSTMTEEIKNDEIISNLNPCNALIYSQSIYLQASSSSEKLKLLPSGTYTSNYPLSFSNVKYVVSKFDSSQFNLKSTNPLKISIQSITINILANHYLDQAGIKLMTGNTINRSFNWDYASHSFEGDQGGATDSIQVKIKPGQNSQGIDQDIGLTWSSLNDSSKTPFFTDKQGQKFNILATITDGGTTLPLNPGSAKPLKPIRLTGCTQLDGSGYCANPYEIDFSIPVSSGTTPKPSATPYRAHGVLKIWGDFNPNK
ncbi:hypothetical protein [Dongshaea marina]|uniref:hypothetical protein n=1 Tax=Dongshaea marina TaxID=2047966 RepID=UPI000D3E80A1|nr:hypothetical protein [Dongshaea marina]